MDALEQLDDLPVHTPPNHHNLKMDVLPKTFLQIILAAKWLIRYSSMHPQKQRQPLPSLLYTVNPSSLVSDTIVRVAAPDYFILLRLEIKNLYRCQGMSSLLFQGIHIFYTPSFLTFLRVFFTLSRSLLFQEYFLCRFVFEIFLTYLSDLLQLSGFSN